MKGKKGNKPSKTLIATIDKEIKKVNKAETELKRIFASFSAFNAYIGAQPIKLSAIPQDTTDLGRIGDSVKAVSVMFNLQLYYTTNTTVRIILFQWHPSDLVQPLINDILEDVATFPSLSEPKRDMKDNYRFFYDKKFTVSQYKPIINVNINKKNLKLRKTQFNAGGTVGTNNIYMLVITDNTFINATVYDARYKVEFTDL